jgi:peptidoglycan hydrolase CwlO-like protein
MTTAPDQPPISGEDRAPPAAEHHRPWGWIVACVLLVLVAGGLAVWALGLQGDLDDQRDQTAEAQQQADQANEQLDALSGQLDDLSQTVSDASDELSQAGGDAQQNVQEALDGLRNDLSSVKDRIEQAAGGSGAPEDGSEP